MTELRQYDAFHAITRNQEMARFHAAVNDVRPDLLPLMVQSGTMIENGQPVRFWRFKGYTLIKHEAPKLNWQQRKAIQFLAWLRRVVQ